MVLNDHAKLDDNSSNTEEAFPQFAENVRFPPMLLKKSLLQRGKSFDSLDYEGIGGFRHDGHPNGTGTVVL